MHMPTGKKLTFDQPHPGKELKPYQVKKSIGFLTTIGEYKEDSK